MSIKPCVSYVYWIDSSEFNVRPAKYRSNTKYELICEFRGNTYTYAYDGDSLKYTCYFVAVTVDR